MAEVVTGNVYDKYGTRNPVYRRLMAGYFRSLARVLPDPLPPRLLEVGCGEGHTAAWLARRSSPGRLIAVDIEPRMLARARCEIPSVGFVCGSAAELPFGDGQFDLALFLEVLEHLQHPGEAMKATRRVCSGALVASVPREPLWRVLNMMRGAYWPKLGNTPGHVQHWTRRSFLAFLRQHGTVELVEAPLPWLIARCRLS